MTTAPADYFAFERREYLPSELKSAGPWDFFLSAYDSSERVQRIYDDVQAVTKQWLIHAEYRFAKANHPTHAVEISDSFDSPDVHLFIQDRAEEIRAGSVCVDATGFIRPHLLVLLKSLRDADIREFDILYSDPVRYINDEHTAFTSGPITRVALIPGYEGYHLPSLPDNDILIIGAGYDDEQIARACENKRACKKFVLAGLPSLQPHMYQESILRINRARESIGDLATQHLLFASANHPFAAAQTLHEVVTQEERRAKSVSQDPGNIYLCPIGPKPHVIGFGLYFMRELEDRAASIIYPFAESYPQSTTQGILRTWQYRIEL